MADEWLWLLVPNNLLIQLSSMTTHASAVRVRLVLLESPLELAEALAILVKLGLELSQLRKLRGLVILRWGVHLSVIPRCPRIFLSYGGSTIDGGVLCVVCGSHGPVEVEALRRRVVAIGF